MKLAIIKKKNGRGNNGNSNAVLHGAYSNIATGCIDGRSRIAKTYNYIVRNLIVELGSEPSLQQRLLVERIAAKSIRCMLAEIEILRGTDASQTLETRYLAWANSLRLDLAAIGLERRQKQVMNLRDYLSEEETR
jgi:hypothetical protein